MVVTGAGGRTGSLVLKKLLERPEDYECVGVVRSDKSARQLRQYGATQEQIIVCDILSNDGPALLAQAMDGADRMVICTSAVPKIKPLSLIPVLLAKIFRREQVPRPKFSFKENQNPEQIDWFGQKLQIDAAKAAGIKKCVLVGSMGGTDGNNFLNTIGDGNILVWKRRAEAYLIASGLDYTIVHPGGLKDDAEGERELVLDVDDNLISTGSKYRSIPRADVAALCVAALRLGERRAVDVVAKNIGDGAPTKDFQALFSNMSENCSYSDMENDEILTRALN